MRAGEISYSKVDKYRKLTERFIIPFFGNVDVRTIDTLKIREFNLHLAEQEVRNGKLMSAKYRTDILGVLRTMYKDGLESGVLNRAQVPVFPKVNIPEKHFDVLEEHEQDEILQKIPEHDQPIYHFIMWYGVRPSEARALMRDAIKADYTEATIKRTFTRNNSLKENPKEGKWRVIPLMEETTEILKDMTSHIDGYIFRNKWGKSYSQSYLNDTWNKACKEAGYKYIPLKNASRHSLGTKLAREGHGENIIATVLGHSDTKTTKKYIRYAAETLKPFFKRQVKKATVYELSMAKNKKEDKPKE